MHLCLDPKQRERIFGPIRTNVLGVFLFTKAVCFTLISYPLNPHNYKSPIWELLDKISILTIWLIDHFPKINAYVIKSPIHIVN